MSKIVLFVFAALVVCAAAYPQYGYGGAHQPDHHQGGQHGGHHGAGHGDLGYNQHEGYGGHQGAGHGDFDHSGYARIQPISGPNNDYFQGEYGQGGQHHEHGHGHGHHGY